ncbi:MAG: GntR family transcriptional regulator [Myxococcales bacterium]|nr:GntR family transcriptional regulator [Myxococcales bacterium]MCB9708042.1 GntR family transcriptional regulator [Myxococcales bacterium]
MLSGFPIYIVPSSGVPIYRQIIDQVQAQVASGRMAVGQFLPSVRETAAALEINPMTVSKAYASLEQLDVVEHVRGRGMRISSNKPADNASQSLVQVRSLFEQAVARSHQLALTKEDVLEMIDPLLDQLGSNNDCKG